MDTALRETLRRRAGGRCEYCHLPERLATLRFQQDHVISQKHRGPAALANLAWSCAECNAHKGSDLAGVDVQTGKLEHLFNPRTDNWEEHFQWNGAELVGKTAIGRVTVAVLRLNREERVAVRRELIAARLHPQS